MKAALSFLAFLLVAASASAADPIPPLKPIRFAAGATSGSVSSGVVRGERDLYSLGAGAGQKMTVTISSVENNAVFQIYEPGTKIGRDPDGILNFTGKALPGAGAGEDAMRWTGRLPRAGDYIVVVGGTRGNATYSLSVSIE